MFPSLPASVCRPPDLVARHGAPARSRPGWLCRTPTRAAPLVLSEFGPRHRAPSVLATLVVPGTITPPCRPTPAKPAHSAPQPQGSRAAPRPAPARAPPELGGASGQALRPRRSTLPMALLATPALQRHGRGALSGAGRSPHQRVRPSASTTVLTASAATTNATTVAPHAA